MTREELRAVIAAAIKDATSIGGAPNKPCVTGHFSAADAALAAIEAAGVRLVPVTWTDDDQTGLNAAVYDAMWHWEDRPIDVDDAMSLASALKASISDNGLMIVSASPYAPPGG